MRNKDPAVLFYTQDFLVGTMFMSNEQKGKYITLLCMQHQKGHLSEEDMLSVCGAFDQKVFEKFDKDEEGRYFNPRMEVEKINDKSIALRDQKMFQSDGHSKKLIPITTPYT